MSALSVQHQRQELLREPYSFLLLCKFQLLQHLMLFDYSSQSFHPSLFDSAGCFWLQHLDTWLYYFPVLSAVCLHCLAAACRLALSSPSVPWAHPPPKPQHSRRASRAAAQEFPPSSYRHFKFLRGTVSLSSHSKWNKFKCLMPVVPCRRRACS